MRTILNLLLIIFLFSCSNKEEVSENIPVIYLNPGKAETMKTSDYFDGYQLLAFKDVVCNQISGLVRYPDKVVATADVLSGGIYLSTLYAFDLHGNLLNQIGALGRGPGEYMTANPDILVDRDSMILIFNNLKYMKYTPCGQLLEERGWPLSHWKRQWGSPKLFLDDATLLFTKNFSIWDFSEKAAENLKNAFSLNIVPITGTGKVTSFFPDEERAAYSVMGKAYFYKDTCRFFNEQTGYVYNISASGLVKRYRVDKGAYAGLMTKEEDMEGRNILKIRMLAWDETDKYILGRYLFKNKYYFFFYNKTTCQTRNFDVLEDDLLKVGTKKNRFHPSGYFFSWYSKMQFDFNYLYIFHTPTEFAEMIEFIRSRMNSDEWSLYVQEYSDIMKVYDELNDDSNTIVIGYHFK